MKSKKKKYFLEEHEIIKKIDSKKGCFATDRITVDGCKVGVMYREKVSENSSDSGWVFLAGDEDEEYLGVPENLNIYLLNTICNYDPDVIPFLELPAGSLCTRSENGGFILQKNSK